MSKSRFYDHKHYYIYIYTVLLLTKWNFDWFLKTQHILFLFSQIHSSRVCEQIFWIRLFISSHSVLTNESINTNSTQSHCCVFTIFLITGCRLLLLSCLGQQALLHPPTPRECVVETVRERQREGESAEWGGEMVGGVRTSSWGPLVVALCLFSHFDWGKKQMTATRRGERLKTQRARERQTERVESHHAPSLILDLDNSHTTGRRDRSETGRPTCLTVWNHVCGRCEHLHVFVCIPACTCALVCVYKSPPWPNWWLITLSFPVEEVYKSLGACWVPLRLRTLLDQTTARLTAVLICTKPLFSCDSLWYGLDSC